MSTDAVHRHFDELAADEPDAAWSGVLYAEDFDAFEDRPHSGTPVACFSAEDLAAARAEGAELGRAHATTAAEAARDGAVREALAALSRSLDAAAAAAAAANEAHAAGIARVLLGMVGQMLPRWCARFGAAEAQAIAREIVPCLQQETSIVLRASPHTLPVLRETLAGADAALAARIEMVATDALTPGDVDVSWQDGDARRSAAALWADMAAILAPLGLLDADVAPCFAAAPANTAMTVREMADVQ